MDPMSPWLAYVDSFIFLWGYNSMVRQFKEVVHE